MEAIEADASAVEVGKIVASDIGMVSKVLQLVNSAFFGASRRIVDPVAAVVYLGYDTIRALAVQIGVFSQFDSKQTPWFSLDALQQHSVRVAAKAQSLALEEGLSRAVANDCLAAGFLHDIGKLVLASNFPQRYRAVSRHAPNRMLEAEHDEFGTTHAEIGAYLLWLWGIPDVLTEVVALHHRPVQDPDHQLDALRIVSAANSLDRADSNLQPDLGFQSAAPARPLGGLASRGT
jgi:putative nucleotidyltransferase with HDIG domain